MVRVLVGKTVVDHEADALLRLRESSSRVVMDVGTGDGRFVLRGAKDEPSTLYVGVDAVADNMVSTAQKARKKPAKGGAPNTLFIVASLEQLPEFFDEWADVLHVNYPWGSLLAAFVDPRPRLLSRLARLARPGADVHIRLNYSVFEDEAYMGRLGLSPFVPEETVEALGAAGIDVHTSHLFDGPSDERTTWERKLVAGSDRRTYAFDGVRRS